MWYLRHNITSYMIFSFMGYHLKQVNLSQWPKWFFPGKQQVSVHDSYIPVQWYKQLDWKPKIRIFLNFESGSIWKLTEIWQADIEGSWSEPLQATPSADSKVPVSGRRLICAANDSDIGFEKKKKPMIFLLNGRALLERWLGKCRLRSPSGIRPCQPTWAKAQAKMLAAVSYTVLPFSTAESCVLQAVGFSCLR